MMFTFPYKLTIIPAYREILIVYINEYGQDYLILPIPLGFSIEWTANYYLEENPGFPF